MFIEIPAAFELAHWFCAAVTMMSIPRTKRHYAAHGGTAANMAHLLKDAIEWEYRQSVRHLRGWDPVAI